ncbi:hypothetical protein BDZ85DRAFT_265143 [Elsinoe ampelina]|uniref:Rhodopsin domain-containing protein n=1 Tax=Elsinoe ampelina TaxID=302913 RepID=A0A6A6G6R4_9PEZI|nr:hypothetical protein BDZ85DRAFT_265143 [Elsinoe ampelina]
MAAATGLGHTILGILWMLVAIGTLLVGLRTYLVIQSRKFRWDFVWITLALISAIVAAAFIQVGVNSGLGAHVARLRFSQIWDVFFWFYLTIYAGTISIGFSKFAVIALLLDVYKGSRVAKRRYALWAIGAVFGVTTVLEIFLTAFQCNPLHKLWNLTADGVCPLATAGKAISYVHAGTGAVTDIMLALWPIGIVWNLNTSRYMKVSICLLMGLGIIPGIAALIRVWLLVRLHSSSDPTYESGLFILSAAVEAGLLIIVACIPPLRPLFRQAIRGTTITSTHMTGPVTARSNRQNTIKSHHGDGLVEEDKEAPIIMEHSQVVTTKDGQSLDLHPHPLMSSRHDVTTMKITERLRRCKGRRTSLYMFNFPLLHTVLDTRDAPKFERFYPHSGSRSPNDLLRRATDALDRSTARSGTLMS